MSAAVTQMYGKAVLALLASCQVILAPKFDDEDDELVGFEGLGKLFRQSFRWEGMWSVENEGFGPLSGLKCYIHPDEAADLPDNSSAIIGDSCLLAAFYRPGLVGIVTATAFSVVLEAWDPSGRCKVSASWDDSAGFDPEKMDVYHWQVIDRSADRRMYNGVGDMILRFESLFAHQNRLARRREDRLG